MSFFNVSVCAPVTGDDEGKLRGRLGAARQPDERARCSCDDGTNHGGTPPGDAADELHPQQHQEPQSPQPLRGADTPWTIVFTDMW